MLAILQTGGPPNLKVLVIGLALMLAGIAWLVLHMLRRFFKGTREGRKNEMTTAPRIENSAAFMTASMQGVIQKLREQEKELERLHRIEKERAEHTERLSEEVTRNMPAGFLMVNAPGIISGANPAAAGDGVQQLVDAARGPRVPRQFKIIPGAEDAGRGGDCRRRRCCVPWRSS